MWLLVVIGVSGDCRETQRVEFWYLIESGRILTLDPFPLSPSYLISVPPDKPEQLSSNHQLPTTMTEKSQKTAVVTDKAPKALPGIYSQAIKANGFVFVSGAVPMDAESGKIVDGDIQTHTVSYVAPSSFFRVFSSLGHNFPNLALSINA